MSTDKIVAKAKKELAKEKGTPVLEGVAEDLKEKTVSVAKEVIEKLEK